MVDHVQVALDRLVAAGPGADPLPQLREVWQALRPLRRRDWSTADANFRRLNDLIASRDDYRQAVRTALVNLFGQRKSVSLFSDVGILPATGYTAELGRRLAHRILPDSPEPEYLKDALALVFDHPDDAAMLASLPAERRQAFWRKLGPGLGLAEPALRRVVESMLEALLLLGYRVAAAGAEPELRRVYPRIDDHGSPFLGVGAETHRFVESWRQWLLDPELVPEDERHLLVLVDQCETVLTRARDTAARAGTSLRLTFLLVRLRQSLERLRVLASLLTGTQQREGRPELAAGWTELIHGTLTSIVRRNSISDVFGQLTGLMALRVTDNAGRTGEHYIATDRDQYRQIWRSAAGAGVLIAVLALIKIGISHTELPPIQHAMLYGLNYGLGFMIIHMLHFTIATKQPAMTAATLAREIGAPGGGRDRCSRLVALVASTVRSQMAAILGNVLLAVITALGLFALAGMVFGPPVSPEKGAKLLAEVDPLHTGTVFFAAIAGVYLFLAGLISGWVDNWVVFSRFGPRVAALHWLRRLLGGRGAQGLAGWLECNLGGLAGNFLFGVMLGSTGTIGVLLGLPLDIRHIAFASANVAYGLMAQGLLVAPQVLALAVLGVAVIGMVNLAVSFSLALWVAFRARGVAVRERRGLLRAVLGRMLLRPDEFLLPPRRSVVARGED